MAKTKATRWRHTLPSLLFIAKNEKAKLFYQHFGFLPLVDQAMRLFIPLDTIATVDVITIESPSSSRSSS